MKQFIMLVALLATVLSAHAQESITLPPPTPHQLLQMPLHQVLQQRRSVRSYADQPLSDQQLATLLWAACGISEPETGKITAPSTVNAQDIRVYVCRADGVWLYEPQLNQLSRTHTADLRPAIAGGQDFAQTAPVCLLLVCDMNKMGSLDWGNKDVAYVSENIYLACTAMGLGTVARGTMDRETIVSTLQLGDKLVPLLNHPVGLRQ